MKRPNESLLARRLLETRERGYGFRLFYRRVWRWYLLLALVFGFALTMAALAELEPLFGGFVGAFCGVLLRDAGWVRAIRKSWPFSETVTDWEKVRRIAAGTEAVAADPPMKD